MKLAQTLAIKWKEWPNDSVKVVFDGAQTCNRAEWQAAVDALDFDKCEHSYSNNIGCPECGELNAPKVVEWDGVGLPPVGLDVEIKRGNCTWIDGDEWQIGKTATVMASFLNSRDIEMASVQFPGGHCECILARCLSPIRTAEQVAAEEREKTAEALYMAVMDHKTQYWPTLQHHRKEHYRGLVDAGWQKVAK